MNDTLRSHFGLSSRQPGTGAARSCLEPPKASDTIRCNRTKSRSHADFDLRSHVARLCRCLLRL